MNFKKEISKAIKDSLASLGVPAVNFSLETPKLSSFGDYATNAALLAGKKLNQPPLHVAQKIKIKTKKIKSKF
jgi:arginyl-tRNA synthetase